MIRYALHCEHDHEFEAWFASSGDYDDQAARGLVECPFCASRAVRKAIMAPAVSGTKKTAFKAERAAEIQTLVMEAMGKVRQHVEDNFDYVGDTFAREALAIKEGVAEDRGIYGEATPKEVAELHEAGVNVAPLPPAAAPVPKAKVN